MAGAAFKRLGNQVDRAKRLMTTFGRQIKRAMIVSAIAIAGLGAALIKLGIDAVESENLFRESFGGMADAARAWSEEISKRLGLNEFKIRKQAATFFVMVNSMGLTEDAAFDLSKGLTQLAYDMASFYNLKPEEAFEKLRAGISGESEPLKRLGILVLENTIKETAYAKAILATGRQLTQAEKVMARYQAIMEQTTKAQGDMARTAKDPANVLRRVRESFTEMGTKIGFAIVQSDAFKDSMVALSDRVQALSESGAIEKWTSRAVSAFAKVKDIVSGTATVVEAFVKGDKGFRVEVFKKIGDSLFHWLAIAWRAFLILVKGSINFIVKPIALAFREELLNFGQSIADAMADTIGFKTLGEKLRAGISGGKLTLAQERVRVRKGGMSDVAVAMQEARASFDRDVGIARGHLNQIGANASALVGAAKEVIARDVAESRARQRSESLVKRYGYSVTPRSRERIIQQLAVTSPIEVNIAIDKFGGTDKEKDELRKLIKTEFEALQEKQVKAIMKEFGRIAKRATVTASIGI